VPEKEDAMSKERVNQDTVSRQVWGSHVPRHR
jgi:hypothetical protein